MAREFSPEELGITPARREFTPQELGVSPFDKPKERTWGEAATDTGASLVSGLGSLVQVPSQIYGLATGDFSDTGLMALGKGIQKTGNEWKSEALRQKELQRAAKTAEAEKEGLVSEFKTFIGETVKDPALLTSLLTEQAPQVIGPGLLGKGVKGIVFAKETLKGVAEKEAAAAAAKAGVGTAVGTNVVMQGADIGAGTYEETYNEMIRRGIDPQTAKDEALSLARMSGASGAVISLLTQRLPGSRTIEKALVGVPGASGRLAGAGKGFLGEGISEALEEGGGKLSQNVAMYQVDPSTELLRGVGTAAGMGAVGGGAFGTVGGALRTPQDKVKEGIQTEEAKTETKATPPSTLLLPSPEEIIVNQRQYDPLQNPLGNFTANELTPEQIKYIDADRKNNGKPRLASYSLEDLVDAINYSSDTPEAKLGAINTLLTFKSGYTGEEILTPQDVFNMAEMKNVETQTTGFNDFLRRTTGTDDLNNMSEPQLYSAFTALSKLPVAETLQILPEGTNAVRFSEKQYADALKGLEGVYDEFGTNALSRTSVIQEIQDFSGLERAADAEALYKQALRNNDLEETLRQVKTTEGVKTVPEVSFAGKTEALPSGFEIVEQEFKQGVMPESYEIRNGRALIDTAKTEEEANRILEKQSKINQDLVKEPLAKIAKLEKAIEARNRAVDIQKAKGYTPTLGFQKMSAHVDALNKADQKSIEVHQNDIKNFNNPLQIVPIGEKPVTAKKQVFYENGKPVASFGDKYQAEQFGIMKLDDAILQQIIDSAPTTKGILPKRYAAFAAKEIERRAGKAPKGIEVKKSFYSDKVNEDFEKLQKTLLPALKRFGLDSVALRIVDSIADGKADGSYVKELIKIAYNAENPMGTLRHESIHALKELGAFTDAEWKVLSNKAKSDWIDTYIKKPNLYKSYQDAYKAENGNLNGFDEYIIEEAIAEAFSDFANTKPPAGLIGNIFYRLNKMFEALGNTFKRLGYTTANDIFSKVEEGKLAPTQGVKNAKEKRSLKKYTPEGLPESEVRPSDRGTEVSGRGDRGRGQEVRSLEALAGAPIVEGATGPDSGLVSVAERYAEANGIPYERQKTYVQLDEDRAQRIAQAYEDMENAPNDPKVKAAYKDMMSQIRKQYDALIDDGYEFTFFDSATDPYDGNPWNAMRDLRNNKRMAVYGTYDGFGTEGITTEESKGNILLANTGLKWKDQNGVEHPVTANDLFRAVHDAFGHGLEGAGFRAQGEENAWQAHARLFTGPALGALTSETRGQNSWLNFGKYGEQNKNAKVEDTIFAPQKIGLMPEWTWEEGLSEPKGIVLGKKQPDAQTYEGIHYSNAERKSLDGSSFGKGLKGAESKRLVESDDPRIKNRVYFYIPLDSTGKNIPKEAGVGNYAHKQTFSNILPPGSEMSRLNAEAGGNANRFESLVVDAGYDGYAVPSMGMMVILNHNNIPVKPRGTQAEMKVKGEKFQIKPPKTEEFKQWFKGSKVVDEDGKPLIVYHGTPEAFEGESFKATKPRNRSGNVAGYYFTSYIGEAEGFTESPKDKAIGQALGYTPSKEYATRMMNFGEGAQILPAFLSIKNPFVKGSEVTPRMLEQYRQELAKDNSNLDDSWVDSKVEIMKERGAEGRYAAPGIFANISFPDEAKQRVLKAGGYDGFQDGRHWVAFEPSQVKSAFNEEPISSGDKFQLKPQQDFEVEETGRKDNLIFLLQDKQIDLKRIIDGLKAQGKEIADKWNAYLQEELFHGRSATRVKFFINRELNPLLSQMNDAGITLEQMDDYLLARHAKEANEYIRSINKDPNANAGMTDAEAEAYIKAIPPMRRQVFERLAGEVDKMTKETRQMMVDYGLETQATIDAWEKTYKNYVPLFREETEGSPISTGRGYSIRGSTTRSRTGSSKKVVDVLANVALQRERTIARGEKNRVGNALLGLILQNPNSDYWIAVNPDDVTQDDLRSELIAMGLDPDVADNLADKPKERKLNKDTGLYEYKTNPVWMQQPNVFMTRVNGQDRIMVFNENNERAARMAVIFNNLDQNQKGQALAMMGTAGQYFQDAINVVGKGTRYFAAINTQYNPAFSIYNFMRDVGGAVLNLQSTALKGKEYEVISNAFTALKAVYQDLRLERSGQQANSKWAEIFEEFELEGGKTGFRDLFNDSETRARALESELEAFKQGGTRQKAKAVFDWLSDFNEAIENAIRVSAYKSAKDMGMSPQQAASLAKNLTVNFNRTGAMSKSFTTLYAFFNASVQGSARIAQTLMNSDGTLSSAGKMIVKGGITLGIMQAVMMATAGFEEDEPPDFVKDKNFVIPYGDKKYIAIPMPLGFNVIPSFGRRIAEFVMSTDKNVGKAVFEMGNMILDGFNPLGSATFAQTLTPTLIDPVIALGENKDFAGKPISRDDINSLNPTPGYTRGRDNASALSTGLAYAVNLLSGGTEFKKGVISPTPDQIDYLIGQVTGGVGREVLKVEKSIGAAVKGEELATFNIPIVGRMVGDIKQKTVETSRFYDNIKSMNEHQQEIDGRLKQGEDIDSYLDKYPEAAMYKYADRVYNKITKLKQKRKKLKESGGDDADLKAYDDAILEIMTTFNETLKDAKES
jgi:hypothetical protein